jgi:hypothetical protein
LRSWVASSVSLSSRCDLDSQGEGDNDERLSAVTPNHEHIAALKPRVKLRESSRPYFDFDDTISPEDPNSKITAVFAAGRSTQRNALCREALIL